MQKALQNLDKDTFWKLNFMNVSSVQYILELFFSGRFDEILSVIVATISKIRLPLSLALLLPAN
jgi:hypothetical protein